MPKKKVLSESDICAKFITPAIVQAGWDEIKARVDGGAGKGRMTDLSAIRKFRLT